LSGSAGGVVVLCDGAGDWDSFLVWDGALQNIFKAVYTPNALGTTDSVPGKSAVTYTEEISRAVRSLFKITIGADQGGDRIEISGAELPATDKSPANAKYYPVVIDIGVPGASGANTGLPVFSIRAGGLGTAETNYDHIRLRVNRDARLVIEADNDPEHAGPTGACPYGRLAGGTVEVMGGGRLRNGAYRGFPLGRGSVIIVRLGSWFVTGPEPEGTADRDRLGYDAAWLAGPIGEDAALRWGAGDQNGSYIEVRDIPRPGDPDGGEGGTLTFDANVTLRKTLALRYNVWFVNSPTLTIDAAGDSFTIGGQKGLVAENDGYKLYGTYFQTGGQNPARPAAKIIVMRDSGISHSAFSPDGEGFFEAGSAVTISNRGSAGGAERVEYGRDSIEGYCNWNVP
jgi:hypothetical protein